jgi:hypothetical protein
VGNSIRNGVAALMRPTPELRAAANEIAGRHEDPLARARAVHEHVSEALSPEGPAVDFGTPASVSYSAGRGNRALVAKVLLDLLGVRSELVVARPVPEKGFFIDSPNPNQFGYPLLRVRDEERRAYLDLVDVNHPFDRIPFFLRGSDALVVPDPGQGRIRIEEVPRGEDDPFRSEQEAELRLAEDGSVSGRIVQLFRDAAADGMRESLKSASEEARTRSFSQIVDALYAGASLVDAKVSGIDELEAPLTLEMEMAGGSLGNGEGRTLTIPLISMPAELRRNWASLETRRYALLLGEPESMREVARIVPPAGYRVERIPEAVEISSEFGSYRLAAEAGTDGSVTVTREIRIPFQRIEAGDYGRFVAFAATVDRAEEGRLELLRQDPY